MARYQEDEFDRLASQHTAAPAYLKKAGNGKWWLAGALILVLMPLLAFLAVTLGGSKTTDAVEKIAPVSGMESPLAPSSESPTSAQSPATGTQGADDSATEQGAEETQGESPSQEGAEEESARDNEDTSQDTQALDATIHVLNASGVQGLAAEKAESVSALGFENVTADNFTGNVPSVTTIYYSGPEYADAAQRIAQNLGIDMYGENAAATGDADIVVILLSER